MNRINSIQVPVTDAEKAEVKRRARADKRGKNMGEFLRDCALQGFTEPELGVRDDDPRLASMDAFVDTLAEVARNDDARLPTPEEIDQLATEIHTTEGEPMESARAIALARLSGL